MTTGKTGLGGIDRDTLIISAMAFGFGALFAWAVIDPPLAHKAVVDAAKSQPSEWPAWVQAIGSLIAVAVAFAVPHQIQERQRAQAVEDRRLRRVSYSLAMLPLAEEFEKRLWAARRIASDWDVPDWPEFASAAELATVPAELQAKAVELHEIGDPGLGLMRAIQSSAAARSRLREWQRYFEWDRQCVDPETGYPEDLPEPGDPDIVLNRCISQLQESIAAMTQALE